MQPSYGNSFVQTYYNANIALAQLLCVKSTTTAEAINAKLIATYGQSSVDLGTPRSWKYYLNISGQYHGTDPMMTVTSLDTLEEINFTSENLIVHTATAAAYKDITSRFYYSLVSRYPEQGLLIKGILYPVDIENALTSIDGTILGYPKDLVEEQEQTLMQDLESFIKRHMIRWNVPAFGLVDTLYNISYHAQLYLAILPKLINLRLLRCKTNEAHSFHIRQYLASHGGLDKFIPYMTLKQALFLYRNIDYIQKNVGKAAIFDLLLEKILTDRQIPLAEYSIRQLSSFDNNYYPLIRARRKAINSQYNVAEKDYVTTGQLFVKEAALAPGNARYHLAKADSDNLTFKTSRSSVIQTKDLESNMVDYSDAVPDPLEAVLLRQWAYMSTHDLYKVVVTFKDPKSSEYRSMYAEDALIYFTYVYLKSVGIEYNLISNVLIEKYRIPSKKNLSEMLGSIDRKDTGAIASATAIWNRQPVIEPCVSTKAFFDTSYLLYEESLKHWVTLGNIHDMRERGTLEHFILKFYGDTMVKPRTTATTINDWLFINNVPEYDYTYLQAQELMTSIFMAATGYVVDETKVLKNIQRNLISLMTELCSYTIQFIREINDSKIRPLNWQATRLHRDNSTASGDLWIESNTRIIDGNSAGASLGTIESAVVDTLQVTADLRKDLFIQRAITVTHKVHVKIDGALTASPVYLNADYPGYNPEVTEQAGYFGKELFDALSTQDKNSIKTFYN